MPYPNTQFFTGRIPFLPPSQQRQSTEGSIKAHNTEALHKRTFRLKTVRDGEARTSCGSLFQAAGPEYGRQ